MATMTRLPMSVQRHHFSLNQKFSPMVNS